MPPLKGQAVAYHAKNSSATQTVYVKTVSVTGERFSHLYDMRRNENWF